MAGHTAECVLLSLLGLCIQDHLTDAAFNYGARSEGINYHTLKEGVRDAVTVYVLSETCECQMLKARLKTC